MFTLVNQGNRENFMSSQADKLVERIQTLMSAINGFEGDIVLRKIEIGQTLLDLKRAANGTWAQRLVDLGFEERNARRLMTIARTWWANGGLAATGLQKELPVDIQKLEALSKLSEAQLREGLPNWDLRTFTRTQVLGNAASTMSDAAVRCGGILIPFWAKWT